MAYVYHDRANKGLSLLFFDPEISQEGDADYDLILEILESFSRLDFPYNATNTIFPITHRESEAERDERLHFDMSAWRLLAAEIDGYGVHQTAFICRKNDPERALVLTLDRGRVLAAVFEEWEIISGSTLLFTSEDYPWDYGMEDILAHKDSGRNKDYIHPSFVAYQNRNNCALA